MDGADRYAGLFRTGQHGRLYLVSGSHARGATFRIFVLPEGEDAKPNGPSNPPLNRDAVEVYGIIGGQPGWTECYGWLHRGRWVEDFSQLVSAREDDIALNSRQVTEETTRREDEEKKHKLSLLASY